MIRFRIAEGDLGDAMLQLMAEFEGREEFASLTIRTLPVTPSCDRDENVQVSILGEDKQIREWLGSTNLVTTDIEQTDDRPDHHHDPDLARYQMTFSLFDPHGNRIERTTLPAIEAIDAIARFVFIHGCDPDAMPDEDGTPSTIDEWDPQRGSVQFAAVKPKS